MSVYRFTTRVAYPDVDQSFYLSMTGAMRMMQEAACIHSDRLGYSFRTVEQTRVHWVLVGWRVRQEGAAKWGQTVHVDTWPRTMARVTSERDFEIKNEREEVLFRATSNWILVSADTGRAARITPELAAAYPLTERPAFEDELSLPALPEGEETWNFQVLRRDLDTNHHVNNLVYLDFARQALPEDIWDRAFREVAVKYSRQLLLGDHVHSVYHHAEGVHQIELKNDDGMVHAAVTFVE